ncbi:MAG TPA: GNAT family N-acyltransferase [Burkholderiales bacterium]|nr:GNAT family N-acyltransferase [Burkholderiales bacterium]
MHPLGSEIPRPELNADVEALPSTQRLVVAERFHVYCARAAQIPRVLPEIGRLRELTFRAVGEGTGKSRDIDFFDSYYLHLFLWDAGAHSVVGAYRLGLADEILPRRGRRGLYTYSLFKYPSRLLASRNPAIELGRSFVRAEYQRDFAPLMLLWRGIARFIERRPWYAVLFGAVSISSSYAPASRRLMVDYLCAHCTETRLAGEVTPRRPYRETAPCEAVSPPRTMHELMRLICEIEQGQKGVPVLLRQYLRLGGRLLGFSCDGKFADALDGLIMVDLRSIEPAILARYMGKAGMAAFRAYHEGARVPLNAGTRTLRAQSRRSSQNAIEERREGRRVLLPIAARDAT